MSAGCSWADKAIPVGVSQTLIMAMISFSLRSRLQNPRTTLLNDYCSAKAPMRTTFQGQMRLQAIIGNCEDLANTS